MKMRAKPDSADTSTPDHGHERGGPLGLIIGSIGVVYGDIGTSPLYALRESLAHSVKADRLTEDDIAFNLGLDLYCYGQVRSLSHARR
jgi:KUP system potassium uptake protein